jgi:hypothetical protein
MFSRPKLICLDTSTWGNLARDVGKDKDAQRVIEIIQDGTMIPYITWHHLAELMHHGNDSVVSSRIALIRSLNFIAFSRQPEEVANVGSALDVKDKEICQLLLHPHASHLQIINSARDQLTNGFMSGKQFCQKNEDWWSLYRNQYSHEVTTKMAEIAAISHFPTTNEDELIPEMHGKYKVCSSEQAAHHFSVLEKELNTRLRNNVKKPLTNPDDLAFELMYEAYQDGINDYGEQKEGMEWFLKKFDIELERLPKNPAVGDMGEEAVFIKQLAIHERRLNLPTGTLRQALRKEMLPSWIVGQCLSREIKRLPKAESGNLNDKMIATFGLYVDHIQLDKRIRHCIKKLAKTSELFQIINNRLIKSSDHKGLVSELEEINQY